MSPKELEELLARNPQINKEQFAEGLAAIRELRKLGIASKGYSSASPYTSKNRWRTNSGSDKRAIRLRSRTGG